MAGRRMRTKAEISELGWSGIAVAAVALSALLFGLPTDWGNAHTALFAVGCMAVAFSPRMQMWPSWPHFHSATLAVAAITVGVQFVAPFAFASALCGTLIGFLVIRRKVSFIELVSSAAGPTLKSVLCTAVFVLTSDGSSTASSPVTQSLLFLVAWHTISAIQNSLVHPPVSRSLADGRIAGFTVSLLDFSSNLTAAVPLSAIVTEQSWFYPIYLLGPILSIYWVTAMEASSERKLSEGVLMLHRMMQTSNPKSMRHMKRVAEYGRQTAIKLGISEGDADLVEVAAIVHDIGKVAVDEDILDFPGRISQEEMDHVRTHAAIGGEILGTVPAYHHVATWVRHHHERVDGTGYPDSLAGEAIPLESRIIAVVDAYDAMVGGPDADDWRSYQPRRTTDEAIGELWRCAGSQFDETVVAAFTETIKEAKPI